jgi:hypothetical protein
VHGEPARAQVADLLPQHATEGLDQGDVAREQTLEERAILRVQVRPPGLQEVGHDEELEQR